MSLVYPIARVCPTGALMFKGEHDNAIVKVTSPLHHDVTRGHLCIKGRFGGQFVHNRPEPDS